MKDSDRYTYMGLEVERRRRCKKYRERALGKAKKVLGLVKTINKRNRLIFGKLIVML